MKLSHLRPRIEPGRAPGGYVVRLYSHSGDLLTERLLTGREEAEEAAALAKTDHLVYGDDVAMAVYDGDTGHLEMAGQPWALAVVMGSVGWVTR